MDTVEFNFGKFKGLTFKDVYEKQPNYAKWIIDVVNKPLEEGKEQNKTFLYFKKYFVRREAHKL